MHTDVITVDWENLQQADLPVFNFGHISSLTDDTGMIQHAVFDIPNRKEGYCLDDNARALLLMVWACRHKKNARVRRLLPVYLSFVHYMQTDDGYFRNFMCYTKACPEERGSEDAFGRTLMALGYLLHEGCHEMSVRTGADIFARAYPHTAGLLSLRGMAYSIIGICQYIKCRYPDDLKKERVIMLADQLVAAYRHNRSDRGERSDGWNRSDGGNGADGWQWFEPVMTYDNAILPLALLHAFEICGDDSYRKTAMRTFGFLESQVFAGDVLRPVGNRGWYEKGGEMAQFDQQGIDVMAMVLFYRLAYQLTGNEEWARKMYRCYGWFLGANDLGLPLYDPLTGGCSDGLHAEGVNLNQGAESTLAYWISHLAVETVLKETGD